MPLMNWQNVLDGLLLKARQEDILQIIETFSTEEELIRFFITSSYKDELLEWIKQMHASSLWKKCDKKAKALREEGNKKFIAKDFETSLHLYSESVRYASRTSEELPLSIANRSASLMHIKLYEDAIRDVELAFKYGYPLNLQYKLHQRKGECLVQLGKYKEASEQFILAQNALRTVGDITQSKKTQISKSIENCLSSSISSIDIGENTKLFEQRDIPNLPVPLQGVNKDLPYASKALSLRENEDKGRYVVAVSNISVGDVLFVEKPFAFVLLPEYYGVRCHHCCKLFRTFFPCLECTLATYCSERCMRNSWNDYHKWECYNGLNIAHSVGIAHLGLRVVLKAGSLSKHKALKQKLKKNEFLGVEHYFAVYHLLTHFDNMSAEDRISYSLTAVCLMLQLVHYTKYFSEIPLAEPSSDKSIEDDFILIGSLILRHICQLVCNGHAITAMQENKQCNNSSVVDVEQVRIATAIFPSASMMNHSCEPNIINSFYGSYLVVKSYKDIKKGQEIFNCYGPHFQRMSTEDRKVSLIAQYHFECKCKKCLRKDEYLEQFTAFACQTCLGPLVENNLQKSMVKCQNCGSAFKSNEILIAATKTIDLFNKGQNHLEMNSIKDALQHFQLCHALQKKYLFKNNTLIQKCLDAISKCHAMLGNYSTSALFLLKTLPAIEERFGSWSIEMGYELQKLVSLLICDLKNGNYVKNVLMEKIFETKKHLQKVKGIFELHYGHWDSSLLDVLEKERELNEIMTP